jgi:hypothetical protein
MRVTKDIDAIGSVLKHGDIWPNIADSEDKDSFTPPIDGVTYLYEPGALFILHGEEDKTQIHANVIKERRGESERLAKEALDYAFNEMGTKVVFAEIPERFENVSSFAGKFMNYDGLIEGSHRYSIGADQWVLSEI